MQCLVAPLVQRLAHRLTQPRRHNGPPAVAFIPTVTPGTTTFGESATLTLAGLGLDTPQGDSTSEAYNEPAIALHSTGMLNDVSSPYTGSITAYHAPAVSDLVAGRSRDGIKEVWVRADGGAWSIITQRSIHPVTGASHFNYIIDPSRYASSGPSAVEAVAIPWTGIPFILQGFPDTGVATRINYLDGCWSMVYHIDKTGSDLPRTTIYKAPPGSGSDAAAGTVGDLTPLATWAGVRTRLNAWATANSGNAGGATIYLTEGLTHTSPAEATNAVRDVIPCGGTRVGRWIQITRAPGLTRDQVRIATYGDGEETDYDATYGTYGASGSSSRMHLIAECMWMHGVEKSTTFVAFGSHRQSDTYHDDGGRARVYGPIPTDGFGDITIPEPGYPDGDIPGQFGSHFNEYYNNECHDIRAPGFGHMTLSHHNVFDDVRPTGDIFQQPKLTYNDTIKYFRKLHVDDNITHGDMVQHTFNTARNWIVESLTATEGNREQGVVAFGQDVRDGAVVDCVIDTDGYEPGTPGYGYTPMKFSGINQNLVIINPQVAGSSTAMFKSTNTSPHNISATVLLESTSYGLSTDPRYNIRFIYRGYPGESDTVVEPDVAPTVDDFYEIFGDNLIESLDANTSATLSPSATDGISISAWSQRLGSANITGGWGISGSRPSPVFNADGLGGLHPTVDFNGDNSTTSAGSVLLGAAAGTWSAIAGSSYCDVMILMDQRDLASDVVTNDDRDVYSWGTGTGATKRALMRVVSTTNKFQAFLGYDATATGVLAPGDFSGVSIIHYIYEDDGGVKTLRAGLYNAAQPGDFVGTDSAEIWANLLTTNYAAVTFTGTVATGTTRRGMACGVSTSAGTGPFIEMGVNRLVAVAGTPTAAQRLDAIRVLKARVGW